jgi:hypothetical protein
MQVGFPEEDFEELFSGSKVSAGTPWLWFSVRRLLLSSILARGDIMLN